MKIRSIPKVRLQTQKPDGERAHEWAPVGESFDVCESVQRVEMG